MSPWLQWHTNDRPPKVDGIPHQVLIDPAPSPLLSPPPPPQSHIQPIGMPPLTEERFMDTFMLFSNLTGIKLDEQDFFVEGHQVDPWELYRTVSLRNGFDSVTMRGEWSMVGVDLGFHSVSCGDPHSLAHCTPAVAHQLHQLYQDTLRHFDQAYSRGIINQLEYGQSFSLAQPQALEGHYHPLAYQPTEADYQALLATVIAVSESSSVMTIEEAAKNILPRFCDVSAADLEAHCVPQHVIAYIEHNRQYLKWWAQNPRFCTGVTRFGSPQFPDQNLFNGGQAIPHSSLHSPQSHSQLQQQRSDRGSMHGGDAKNLSLPQQQIIFALRARVQQGNITHQQALDRLAMMQTSAQSFQEQSVPQQLPPGFNAGAIPSGIIQQQIAAISQRAHVSVNNQMNNLQRVIQSQDHSHPHQFNILLPGKQQQQNGSGITSRAGQNLDPSGMGLLQGTGSLQQNFSQPSPLVPHTNSQSQIPEPGAEPLPHPFHVPTCPPTEQVPMPIGGPPTRPFCSPTIAEVTGPESIQVFPPPGQRPLRTESSPYQPPISQQVSGPPGNLANVPLPELRALSSKLLCVVVQAQKDLQATGSSGEGDIIQRQQLQEKIELNLQRLCKVFELINGKFNASTPYTGIQIAATRNHATPVSANPAAMNGVRSGSIFTQSPSISQIRCLTPEDLIAAKRWTEEKKRMMFSSVLNFDRFTSIQSIPESDIHEYQRNLERLDQVLVNIEKYIYVAFAALKKAEVVERLFKMMASAKYQLEELKKPNPRYALELHTIRGMIQEADNMDKGLKTILQRTQARAMLRCDAPPAAGASQPSPRLDPIPILPSPGSRRDPPQGGDSGPARSPEVATSHREGLFDEEVRIAMNRLEI